MDEISVVIIAKNAEETIKRCLDELHVFSEVILYLNGSSDQTKKIAQSYPNVSVFEGDFIGFGPTKNKAAEYASHEWILSLDSDEILTPRLIQEIGTLDLMDSTTLYQFIRENYFLGHKTQSSDNIIRLYHRSFTGFNDNQVHEKVMVPSNATIIKLKHSFIHLNITHINQTLTKIIQYTDLGSKGKKSCFFGIVIAKSIFAFFKTYILQGNIVRGWVGFALAVNSANKRYYKYIKQFINCQNKKKK